MKELHRQNRPLIGVSPSYNGGRPTVSGLYLDAIWRAGGLGVMLPYTDDPTKWAAYASLFDGFLFSGGVDIDPARYGEIALSCGAQPCGAQPCGALARGSQPCVEIDPARDAFEAGLFAAAYPTGKPILGICRGVQVINVFLGGSLYQHVEGHAQVAPGEVREQAVTVEKGSLLWRICGKKFLMVNSFHHQAVKRVTPDLAVAARAADGGIEALWAPAHPFLLGVQFHPEIYAGLPDDDHAAAIFAAFLGAAGVT